MLVHGLLPPYQNEFSFWEEIPAFNRCMYRKPFHFIMNARKEEAVMLKSFCRCSFLLFDQKANQKPRIIRTGV